MVAIHCLKDPLFSKILSFGQGSDGTGELEQSWLVSTNEVPSLGQRRVGVARMAGNTNMGAGAHEVKFFILILCPSNIKGEASHSNLIIKSLYCTSESRSLKK